ncbi:MAG: hypothetical protein C0498_14345, partial [Anaerolinea sp.]|nr:hypothetical protein [Anaerolinea sp.]
MVGSSSARARASDEEIAMSNDGGPVTIAYFYRTKWGAHDEFVGLFDRNHWPILREQLAAGRFLDVTASKPRFHGDGRADWDFL